MAPLLAGAADYDPGSTAWNGCSELIQLAAAAGFKIEVSQRLDWGNISPDDAVVILYPAGEVAPDPDDALRFLAEGGRLLVADDFGGAEPLMSALELERRAPPDAEAFYGDDPDLPWATAVDPAHVLASRGARSVLGNHPAYLRTKLPPVFVFGPPDGAHAAVVEGRYGEGLFVVVSDPSMLINAMLRHPANRAFAANLMERVAGIWSEPGEETDGDGMIRRRVLLVWGGFKEVGHFTSDGGDGLASRLGMQTLDEHIREFGRWLGSLAGRPVPRILGQLLGAMSLLVVLSVVLWVLPTSRRHYDGDWFGRRSAAPHRALAARRDLSTAARVLEDELWSVLLEGGNDAAPAATSAQLHDRSAGAALVLADRVLRDHASALGTKGAKAAAVRAQRRSIARTIARLQRLAAASYDGTARGVEPSPSEFVAVWRECRDLVTRCGKTARWPAAAPETASEPTNAPANVP